MNETREIISDIEPIRDGDQNRLTRIFTQSQSQLEQGIGFEVNGRTPVVWDLKTPNFQESRIFSIVVINKIRINSNQPRLIVLQMVQILHREWWRMVEIVA